MVGLGLAIPWLAMPGPAPDVATAALIGRMTTRPSGTRAAQIDCLVRALKAAGVWGKLDCLYLLAAHDAQAARLDWTGGGHDATEVNAPVFTADRGYRGDGTSSYLDTGFVPGNGQTLRDSHHLSAWILDNAASAAAVAGTDMLSLAARGTGDTLATRSSSANADSSACADSRGFWLLSRSDGAGYARYHDGVAVDAPSRASAAFSGLYSLYVCGRHTTSGFGSNTQQAALMSVGGALSAPEQAAFHDAAAPSLTAIGAA